MSAVNKTHPDYDEMLPVWKRCTDVTDGTRKLWEFGPDYLPYLTDETEEEYQARLHRAVLFNATWRTIVGYLGLLFRKPAVITMPEELRWMADDITLTGVSLRVFALELSEVCLTTGRAGIWVNYPPAVPGATQADVERLNLRPSMQLFNQDDIYNWREERINNKKVVSQIRLKEKVTLVEDEFASKEGTHYRVLDLTADRPDGIPSDGQRVYRVRVFSVNAKDEDVLEESFFPMMDGQFMTEIPFYPVSPDDVTIEVDEPPLVDLVDMNVAHFQVTAAYENGCHWSGIPTLAITGHEVKEGDEIKVGGSNALVLPAPTARVELIEVGTSGFAALEKNLDRKEAQMVVLGSRLLEVQKPGIEAAETALIHRSGEQSVLSNISHTMSTGISAALVTFVRWAGSKEHASFRLNTDFFNTPLSAPLLKEIVAGWQAGAYSDETKFKLLQRGEVYEPDASFEDEQKLISQQSQGGIAP